jgi:hypothetical protein
MEPHVEWSDDHGLIDFGWGLCTLRADLGVLTLRVEAADEEGLRRLQDRVAELLERFGRRDHLTVTWIPLHGAADPRPSQPAGHDGGGHRHG